MSKFNQLRSQFGETKDAIFVYKRVNFKELSSKLEKLAKHQSIIEQEKSFKRKILIKERDKQLKSKENKEKIIQSIGMYLDTPKFANRNEYKKRLLKVIKKNEQLFESELDRGDRDKLAENRYHLKRETKEQEELEQLLKQFKEYYYRDYHFLYDQPYKRPKIYISCFKENEELKANLLESNFLEKDYLDVYKDIKLLSIKNLQRYDCWDDISPQEWLALCKKENLVEDGKSPNYFEGNFLLAPIKVEKYDEEQMKFLVVFTELKNTYKLVSRLSVLFLV